MKPRTQKIVIPVMFVLVLAAIVIGMFALTTNAGLTSNPKAVSGQSTKHRKTVVVPLPPVSTTTTTTVAATPVTSTTRVTEILVQPKTPVTTTTTTTVPMVRTVAPPVATTTTTTPPVSPTTAPAVTVQTVTTGILTAPDGLECSAGVDQECVLVKVIPVNGNLASFVIIGAGGNAVGLFNAEFDSQPYCLIHWLIKPPIGTVASSPDCSGGPVESTQTTIEFTYGYLS